MARNQNLFSPSDKKDEKGSIGMGSNAGVQKFFNVAITAAGKLYGVFQKIEKSAANTEKSIKNAANVKLNAPDDKKGSGGGGGKKTSGLGLADMPELPGITKAEKIAGGITLAAGTVSLGMGLMPNTQNAVALRMAADSMAGLSGISAQSAIVRANRAVGNGATSAVGPTQAMASIAYSGGYLANTLSSKNIMASVGGLSALTGGTNEQVAGALSGMNGMSFLRMGVRIRDKNGQLRPIPDIINDVWRFFYGGRKVSVDEVMLSAMNPGGKVYNSLIQITGGNQELMAQIQMGLVARARNNAPLDKKSLTGSTKALDLLGVGKDSPTRAQFNYNTSEAKLLQNTNQGLNAGYTASLNTAAAANNALADFAKTLPEVTNLLGRLKGVLQTLPGLGGFGGTVASVASSAVSLGGMYLQNKALSQMLGMSKLGGAAATEGVAAAEGSALANAGGYSVAAALAGKDPYTGAGKAGGLFGRFGKLGRFAKFGKFLKGAGGLTILGTVLGMLKDPMDRMKLMKDHPGLRRGADIALNTGKWAAYGGAIGSIIPGVGTAIGAGVGALGGLISGIFGGGGNDTPGLGMASHYDFGVGGEDGGSQAMDTTPVKKSAKYQVPTPKATITSGYGMRQDPHTKSRKLKKHSGIDYGVKKGTPVYASADGKVTHTGKDKDYGNYVIITHGDKSTLYAHLSRIDVRPGQTVTQGQRIGLSGGKPGDTGAGNSTGPHLHFELRDNGPVGAQGRVDPRKYLGKDAKFSPPLPTQAGAPLKRSGRNPKSVSLTSISDASLLNSMELSARLGTAMEQGLSMSLKDITKELGKKASTARDVEGNLLIDTGDNLTSGDIQHKIPGGRSGLMKMLYAQGFRGNSLNTAFAIALAESGGRPDAVGDVKLQDAKWGPSYGLFQIRSLKHWQNYDGKGSSDQYRDGSRLRDPKYNIRAAWEKSKGGKNWHAWSTYTGGQFIKYLDDASRVAKQTGYGIGGSDASGMSLESSQPALAMAGARNVRADFNATQKIEIKVDMNVTLQNGGVREAQVLLETFNKNLERQLKVKGIGGSL